MGKEFEWGYMKKEQVKAFRKNLKKIRNLAMGGRVEGDQQCWHLKI